MFSGFCSEEYKIDNNYKKKDMWFWLKPNYSLNIQSNNNILKIYTICLHIENLNFL